MNKIFKPNFDEPRHVYLHPKEGYVIPSVTSILSELQVSPPFDSIKSAQKYADRGSCVHKVLELFASKCDNIPQIYNDWKDINGISIAWSEVAPYVEAGKKFIKSMNGAVFKTEVALSNGKFAGTLDFIINNDVGDWKTSKSIADYHMVQVAAYATMTGGKAIIVQLMDDGNFKVFDVDEDYKNKWKMLLDLYWQDIPLEEKIKQAKKIIKDYVDIPNEIGNNLSIAKRFADEAAKEYERWKEKTIEYLTNEGGINPGIYENNESKITVSKKGRITITEKK